jgi:flagellar biosynthesis/type III secretory pathway chaperone
MNAHLEKLEEVLGEELRIYGGLLDACSAVTEKVLCCDIDGLAEVTREQNALIMAAAETEKTRTALLRELLESNEQPENAAEAETNSALQFIAEPYASRLASHGERLRGIVRELRQISRKNRSILNYTLQLIDRAVRFMYGTTESDGIYESHGSCKDRARATNGLLNKEA